MTSPEPPQRPRNTPGGGAPIALLIMLGVLIGGLLGQPSIGFLVGAAMGLGIALLMWWRGR